MRQRHTQVLLLALAMLVAGCNRMPPSPPAHNAYVGKSESTVRGLLGQPDHEFAGHFGLPDANWTRQFTGEIKTSVFNEGGNEVYVSYEKLSGTWIVVHDQAVPKGTAF